MYKSLPEQYIIGIPSQDRQTIRSFRDEHKINYPLVIELDLPSPYTNVTSLAKTFFIDCDGIIRYVIEGYHDFEELNALVVAMAQKDDQNQQQE